MKKILKIFTIIAGIIVLGILTYFILFFNGIIISLSPDLSIIGQNDFCRDSDASSINPSKVKGEVLSLHRDRSSCSWINLNKIDGNISHLCAYSLTYNDYCLNLNTLREKICINDVVNSRDINCLNGCSGGKCL
ncbi:MAG: hypothetical protein AABY22_09655 [Nanoarchaeota archaeon]